MPASLTGLLRVQQPFGEQRSCDASKEADLRAGCKHPVLERPDHLLVHRKGAHVIPSIVALAAAYEMRCKDVKLTRSEAWRAEDGRAVLRFVVGRPNDLVAAEVPSGECRNSTRQREAASSNFGIGSSNAPARMFVKRFVGRSFSRSTRDPDLCTVALEDPANDVGVINEDGTLELDRARLLKWVRGLSSGDAVELGLPDAEYHARVGIAWTAAEPGQQTSPGAPWILVTPWATSRIPL